VPPEPHPSRSLPCLETLARPIKIPTLLTVRRRRLMGDFSLSTARREEERGRRRSWERGELEAAQGGARSRCAAGPTGHRPGCRQGRQTGGAVLEPLLRCT
jgi:hypothetical protein